MKITIEIDEGKVVSTSSERASGERPAASEPDVAVHDAGAAPGEGEDAAALAQAEALPAGLEPGPAAPAGRSFSPRAIRAKRWPSSSRKSRSEIRISL